MEKRIATRVDHVLAVGLGLVALVTYLSTLAVGSFPGEFALVLGQAAGLLPRMSPDHPLWFGAAWLARVLIPTHDPAIPLHVLSAVSGAVAVGLMYRVIGGAVAGLIVCDEEEDAHARMASRLAGAGAALGLTFAIPFWIVSTRCHYAAFDLALFLFATHLLLRFAVTGRRRLGCSFAFLYGLGVVEYPTFTIFAFLYLLVYGLILWRREQTGFRHLWPPVAAFAAGLLLYAVAAWSLVGTEGYELRGYANFFEVLWFMWRDQWFFITRGLPQQGWLIVVVCSILPALTAAMIAGRALNVDRDWTYALLHVVLSVFAVAVLLNTKIAPWPQAGYRRLLVMPYALTAGLFGHLVGYWYWLSQTSGRRLERPTLPALRRVGAALLILIAVGLPIATAVRNRSQADGRASAMIRRFASAVVDGVGEREWLVTDGSFDMAIRLEARRAGKALKLIDLSNENNALTRRQVARFLTDAHWRNLALTSLERFVRDWLGSEPGIADRVALMTTPELWQRSGMRSMPHETVFLGTPAGAALDAEALMSTHRAFWKEMLSLPEFSDTTDVGPLEGHRTYIRRHVSLVANNLGVLMEDLGRADDAFEAYSRARELLPQNASALINQFTMMRMGYAITQSNALQVSAEQLGKTLAPGLRKIGALSRYYGEVRSPGAFAGLGWEWIGVGDGDLAASNLQRAMGLLPEDGRDAVKQRLASLYLMGDQNTESQALFYELLVENPRNAGALLGMARIELAGGNFERAADYLRRAAKANAPQSLMDMEWAAYYIAKGDVEEAQRLLNDVLREHPRLERAWAMLISIAIQEADETALEACVRNLQRLGGDNAFLQAVATGYLAALRGDIIAATNAFEEALRVDPSSTMAIDMLVRFALARNDGSAAERWARRLLRLDADHPLANRIVAMRQMERKEYDLAVDSLRRSLKGEEDPRALNNLAWLLQESGLNSEAEAHVRQALELKPDLNSAWDTLGVILMKTERFDEAAQAFGKCIELAPDGALAKLHLAQLDLATDEPATARRVVDELTPRKGELTVEEADLLDEITRRLNR